jgi:hypothetical protein
MNSSTMQTVECRCLFDITATAVNGTQRNIQYPYITKNGTQINDALALSQARNQQRNLDTILQLTGMRTQIFEITDPELVSDIPAEFVWAGKEAKIWQFSFEIEPQSQWSVDNDEFWILKNDSDHTPMLIGLTETAQMDPWLVTQGDRINIIYHAQTTK